MVLSIFFWIVIFLISLIILIKSSDKLVDSSKELGLLLGIPTIIIGFIFLSIGTTMPELITAIISTIEGVSEIGVSNVIGTMMLNIILLIVLIGFIKKEYTFRTHIRRDLLFLSIVSLLFIFFIIDLKYTIIEGIISLVILVFYINYLYKNKTTDIEFKTKLGITQKEENKRIIKNLFLMFICFVILYISSKYMVLSIIKISEILKISASIISITIISMGTSFPELFVALSAIKKNEIKLTIGNIIGANVINALGVLAIASIIGKIVITKIVYYAIPFFIIITTLFVVILSNKKITRNHAIFALITYAGFIIGLIIMI